MGEHYDDHSHSHVSSPRSHHDHHDDHHHPRNHHHDHHHKHAYDDPNYQPIKPIPTKWYYVTEACAKVAVLLVPIFMFAFLPPYPRHLAWREEDRHKPILPESVGTWLAFGINFAIGIIFLCFLVGAIIYHSKTNHMKRKIVLQQLLKAIISGAGALIYTWGITEPLKRFVAEPRPHFLARCYGDMEHIPPLEQIDNYLDNETCWGYASVNLGSEAPTKDEFFDLINEDRMSFPSGHSAFTAVLFMWMGFCSFYITDMLRVPGYSAVGAAILILMAVPMNFIATSRIRDVWHAWHDVLGGLIIGTAVSLWQYLGYYPKRGVMHVSPREYYHQQENLCYK